MNRLDESAVRSREDGRGGAGVPDKSLADYPCRPQETIDESGHPLVAARLQDPLRIDAHFFGVSRYRAWRCEAVTGKFRGGGLLLSSSDRWDDLEHNYAILYCHTGQSQAELCDLHSWSSFRCLLIPPGILTWKFEG